MRCHQQFRVVSTLDFPGGHNSKAAPAAPPVAPVLQKCVTSLFSTTLTHTVHKSEAQFRTPCEQSRWGEPRVEQRKNTHRCIHFGSFDTQTTFLASTYKLGLNSHIVDNLRKSKHLVHTLQQLPYLYVLAPGR